MSRQMLGSLMLDSVRVGGLVLPAVKLEVYAGRDRQGLVRGYWWFVHARLGPELRFSSNAYMAQLQDYLSLRQWQLCAMSHTGAACRLFAVRVNSWLFGHFQGSCQGVEFYTQLPCRSYARTAPGWPPIPRSV